MMPDALAAAEQFGSRGLDPGHLWCPIVPIR
jgi:hypothetical protein